MQLMDSSHSQRQSAGGEPSREAVFACRICRRVVDAQAPACGHRPEDATLRSLERVPRAVQEHFDVTEILAAGRSGTLYRATERSTGTVGVLRVFRREVVEDASARERLERELARQIETPSTGVSRVIAKGESDGAVWIFREWLEGTSLAERLSRGGALSVELAAWIASRIADSLEELHANALLHRDLTPDHILLGAAQDGAATVTLLDPGIVARIPGSHGVDIWGTRGYLAPEQLVGHLTSVRSELYALGLVLYEMLHGESPIDASGPSTELPVNRLVSGELSLAGEIPTELTSLIQSLLARDPRSRPTSAAAVRDTLARFVPSRSVFAVEVLVNPTNDPNDSNVARTAPQTPGRFELPRPQAIPAEAPVAPRRGSIPPPPPPRASVAAEPVDEAVGAARPALDYDDLAETTARASDDVLGDLGALVGGTSAPPPAPPSDVIVSPMTPAPSTSANASSDDEMPVAVEPSVVALNPLDLEPVEPSTVTVNPMDVEMLEASQVAPNPLLASPHIVVVNTPAAAPAFAPAPQTAAIEAAIAETQAALVTASSASVEPARASAPSINGWVSVPTEVARISTNPGALMPSVASASSAPPAMPQMAAPAMPQMAAPVMPQMAAPVMPQMAAPTMPQMHAHAAPVYAAPAYSVPTAASTSEITARGATSTSKKARGMSPLVVALLAFLGGGAIAGAAAFVALRASSNDAAPTPMPTARVAPAPAPIPALPAKPADTFAPVAEPMGPVAEPMPVVAAPAPTPEPVVEAAPAPTAVAAPAAAAPAPTARDANRDTSRASSSTRSTSSRVETTAPVAAAPAAAPAPTAAPAPAASAFDALRTQAREHFSAGRFADAAAVYERACAMNPSHAGSFAGLGAARLAMNDARGAVAAYQRAVQLSPNTSGYFSALGRALGTAGDNAGAVRAFQRALELDPNNAAARTALERLGAR